jgi:hypothetical protein
VYSTAYPGRVRRTFSFRKSWAFGELLIMPS